ncbi:hypothetical protein TraAM80_07569, partial [Trypanosoma rangeli]
SSADVGEGTASLLGARKLTTNCSAAAPAFAVGKPESSCDDLSALSIFDGLAACAKYRSASCNVASDETPVRGPIDLLLTVRLVGLERAMGRLAAPPNPHIERDPRAATVRRKTASPPAQMKRAQQPGV